MENSDQVSHIKCFRDWMDLQERDLSELLQFLSLDNDDGVDRNTELRELVDKNIRHFREYADQRATDAPHDVSSYFCPTWCTSLEGSMLWAGGCRPSIFIRLVYALTGRDVLSHLDNNNTPRGSRNGTLGDLSADQVISINSLHLRAIEEEDKISGNLASLQEVVADQPLAIIARELPAHGEASAEADEALKALDLSMTSLLRQADNLRLKTLKELIGILTPTQAVDFLATAKKLHLCLHKWGRQRDARHGRK